MKSKHFAACGLVIMTILTLASCAKPKSKMHLVPEPMSMNNDPDAHFVIVFEDPVQKIVRKGKIAVYDSNTDNLVDEIDLSIPPYPEEKRQKDVNEHYLTTPYDFSRTRQATNRDTRPGTPSAPEAEDEIGEYQTSIIGGFTDGFHFDPIFVEDSIVVIQMHHNILEYGHHYYITVDPGIIVQADGSSPGISKGDKWEFSTRGNGPVLEKGVLRVSRYGDKDFRSVQEAIDYVPDSMTTPVVIEIDPGQYHEIIYFRNKTNLTLRGADKDKVRIFYENCDNRNPHPRRIIANEQKGSFPFRRSVMAIDNCSDIIIENLTIENTSNGEMGQGEGLISQSEHLVVKNCRIKSVQRAVACNGTTFFQDCILEGGFDVVLSMGPNFYYRCQLINSGGPFIWPRNEEGQRGLVFLECTFLGNLSRLSDYGRTNSLTSRKFPYAEMVLINCREKHISPTGWSVIGSKDNFFAEYGTRYYENGEPVDMESRHPYSRHLTPVKDADLVKKYATASWVLGGWNPNENRSKQ